MFMVAEWHAIFIVKGELIVGNLDGYGHQNGIVVTFR